MQHKIIHIIEYPIRYTMRPIRYPIQHMMHCMMLYTIQLQYCTQCTTCESQCNTQSTATCNAIYIQYARRQWMQYSTQRDAQWNTACNPPYLAQDCTHYSPQCTMQYTKQSTQHNTMRYDRTQHNTIQYQTIHVNAYFTNQSTMQEHTHITACNTKYPKVFLCCCIATELEHRSEKWSSFH